MCDSSALSSHALMFESARIHLITDLLCPLPTLLEHVQCSWKDEPSQPSAHHRAAAWGKALSENVDL